ncbi:MAG: hypothetical protein WCS95_07935 [Lentisphaeria bacterium]
MQLFFISGRVGFCAGALACGLLRRASRFGFAATGGLTGLFAALSLLCFLVTGGFFAVASSFGFAALSLLCFLVTGGFFAVASSFTIRVHFLAPGFSITVFGACLLGFTFVCLSLAGGGLAFLGAQLQHCQ